METPQASPFLNRPPLTKEISIQSDRYCPPLFTRGDIPVIPRGNIPERDFQFLEKEGVAGIFGPGTVIADAAADILNRMLDEVMG